MSVNLLLLPLSGLEALEGEEVFCGTQLRLDPDNELVEIISGFRSDYPGVESREIPDGLIVKYYGESGLIETQRSEVGRRLWFSYAGDFRKIERRLQKNKFRHMSPENKAALAYISALPRSTPIILNWC